VRATPPAARLELAALSVQLPTGARPLLADLSLRLEPGEVVGVLGRSGAGKSTLIHGVSGLLPWLRPATVGGELRLDGDSLLDLDPAQRAHLLGTCLDRPGAQLFLQTPRQELAAARRLHAPAALAEQLVDALGIGPLLDRRITELSSGECQRVALAVAVAASPRPVLLDEPCAHLDVRGVAALAGALAAAARDGGTVLLTEQAGWRLGDAVSRWLELAEGRLEPCSAPAPPRFPTPPATPGERVLLSARGLALARGGRRLLSPVDLELREGEVVLLSGANGVGKSTLARVLVGVEGPMDGRVERFGHRAALMLPSADLQLLASSVAEELRLLDPSPEKGARVLRRHRLEPLAARPPWTLSRGERQRLVHATLDLLRPEILVIDEPAQGLDPEDLVELAQLIHRRAAKGRAYLIISHREELAAAAHRWLEIRDGRLLERGQAQGA
jgi:energy-coupling factor transport system ATP-binding protein